MRAVALVMLIGCGRIGIDPLANLAPDAAIDAAIDAASDAPRVCPADTSPIDDDTCIEKTERGTETWVDAEMACKDLGRRLCGGAEWTLGCKNAPGLVEMANDSAGINWEWVAEVTADIGDKRGLEFCTDMSAHEIFVDPYDFRCCVDI